MQVNRSERLAKAHGLSILGLMAVIALTVYFWPAPPAPVMTSPPLMSGPSLVPATAPPVHRAPKRPHAPAPWPAPAASARIQAVTIELPRAVEFASPLTIEPIASVPGAQIAVPPIPEAPAAGHGAVTQAMQTTGRSVAGAFKKTGGAFRQAF